MVLNGFKLDEMKEQAVMEQKDSKPASKKSAKLTNTNKEVE